MINKKLSKNLLILLAIATTIFSMVFFKNGNNNVLSLVLLFLAFILISISFFIFLKVDKKENSVELKDERNVMIRNSAHYFSNILNLFLEVILAITFIALKNYTLGILLLALILINLIVTYTRGIYLNKKL